VLDTVPPDGRSSPSPADLLQVLAAVTIAHGQTTPPADLCEESPALVAAAPQDLRSAPAPPRLEIPALPVQGHVATPTKNLYVLTTVAAAVAPVHPVVLLQVFGGATPGTFFHQHISST
jgi:hypothetical protein